MSGSFFTLRPHKVGDILSMSSHGMGFTAIVTDVKISDHPVVTTPQYEVYWREK